MSRSAQKVRTKARSDGPGSFVARVLTVVRRIPRGQVATYGEVAARAGRRGAARAVGNIMSSCGRPDVPCHRVIAAGGRLGGYGGNEAIKRALLVAEGVPFSGARVMCPTGNRKRTRYNRPAVRVSPDLQEA